MNKIALIFMAIFSCCIPAAGYGMATGLAWAWNRISNPEDVRETFDTKWYKSTHTNNSKLRGMKNKSFWDKDGDGLYSYFTPYYLEHFLNQIPLKIPFRIPYSEASENGRQVEMIRREISIFNKVLVTKYSIKVECGYILNAEKHKVECFKARNRGDLLDYTIFTPRGTILSVSSFDTVDEGVGKFFCEKSNYYTHYKFSLLGELLLTGSVVTLIGLCSYYWLKHDVTNKS
jgi:hypothetical protein